ncbi:putative nacht and ankyrin domain protein [Rosellinia necatrix]|uniref:Putative nacht and ankyrin domain protein n=1 Tax=Rosellinia necatrix TaxID=77044 RepID=A0A1W2TF74_ROSNE|nr:putative nacht and ankyrin domain protein [Rosellinia necatrix]
MNFGYSVGDFLRVIELAHKLHKRFANAPGEYRTISNEVTNLFNALQQLSTVIQQHLKDRATRALKRVKLDDIEIHNVCSHINLTVSILNCFLVSLNNKALHSTMIGIRNLEGEVDKMGTSIKAVHSGVTGVQSSVVGVQTDVNTVRADVNKTLIRMNSLKANIEEVQVSVQKQYEQEALRREHTETDIIISWLSKIDFADQQTDSLRRREPGTGEWLLVSPEYTSWIQSSRQTLFCPGPPGAGKTIIASIVIDNLHKTFWKDSNVATGYIFYNFRCQQEQQPEDLLLCLAKQIIHGRPIPGVVRDLFRQHNRMKTRPSLNEISTMLSLICTLFTKVFIVIDALDECLTENREKLLSELFGLQKDAPVNIFATSRMIPEIGSWFEDHQELAIRATAADIEKYVETRISRLPAFIRKLRDEIKTEISKVVDGMFLLAQLYVNSLEGKRSIKAVRAALHDLRTGGGTYDAIYGSALERIEDQVQDARELAKQVISWITWARRPISATELQHALGIELGSLALDDENLLDIDYMVSVCAGLVTVDHGSQIIRLVHYTMQEYLERNWKDQAAGFEADMGVICVTLLSFSDFGAGACKTIKDLEERLQAYPFYDYSAQHWGHHARVEVVLNDIVYLFLRDEKKVQAAGQVLQLYYHAYIYKSTLNVTEMVTSLHLAAHFGLTEAVKVLLGDGQPPDPRDGASRTPLFCAAREGHEDMVRLLLENKVDASLRDCFGRTPLCYASQWGSKTVVDMLLEKDVEVDITDVRGMSPLSWAARRGHGYIVERLLAHSKGSLNLGDKNCITPLSCAVTGGHIDIINLLLRTGADPNSGQMFGQSPLAWAVWGRDEGVVRLLLQNGADPNIGHQIGQTGLSHAASKGDKTIVELLLAVDGIDPNLKGRNGETPLSCAARAGHGAVVALLLSHPRVEPNAKDDGGWTALMQAADEGYANVVALLLGTAGVDVNSTDNWGQTPLLRAARNGHVAVVELLLRQEDIEPNLVNTRGWTPLIRAAQRGHGGVVEVLLARGDVDVLCADATGRTALSWAAGRGYETMVERLLLWRPVAAAAAAVNGYDASVEILLGYASAMTTAAAAAAVVVTADTGDCWGWMPLTFAVLNGHHRVV